MLRYSFLRASRLASGVSATPSSGLRAATTVISQSRGVSHAVSNVTLADIEKRWESMPPSEQADLWMSLRDRMKGSWGELTVQEKKASYWIAFGPHGPRAVPPPGETKKIIIYTTIGLVVSFVLFAGSRFAARPPPRTLTAEWLEAEDAYLKGLKVEPLSGISREY
ncbi:Cytochrome c oxidase subunit 5B, mitochondrial [Maublancomyces gigas]|uniref:Cytochrome c oxidase subunit 5B, mitochondrial n=1 Tax=Discina gigas TaxID=1032678 RepID=A0ABR3GPT8_9PEZI